MRPRVAHVIAEYSRHEAMGRTVAETAERVPGTHSLITTVAHDGTAPFAEVVELGGGVETFPTGRSDALAAALQSLRPDVVHLHGGALSPLLAAGTAIRHYPLVMTMYAWPTLPGIGRLRRGGFAAAAASNVLRPRVLATTLLPPAVTAAALRRAGIRTVLTPDPKVGRRLSRHLNVPIQRLGSGAPESPRRARFDADEPIVVFAGRAESVRGVDTLIDAFPQVLERFPGARLRLLMMPRPELDDLLALVSRSGISSSVDVDTEPRTDLLADLADAQVGCWPFKFDYTTSPPAMAVAEGLSVGLPVVATEVACIEAVLEPGRGGLFVRPMDPPALAGAINRLLGDPILWREQSGFGPSVVERLGWRRTARTTAAAYELAAPAPRPV